MSDQWSEEAIRTRGKLPRMGTLLIERRSADALAVAEEIASGLGPWKTSRRVDEPQLLRFTINHATLLLRRDAPGDAERAREMVINMASDSRIRRVEADPRRVLRADEELARDLPSLVLALNRFGLHRRAARFGQRLLDAHRSPSPRFHAAALNTSLCWSAEGLALWCAGDADGASDALTRGVDLLTAEVASGAPYLGDSDPETRETAVLLRESNLLYAQLLLLIVEEQANEENLVRHMAKVNDLLDRSERNRAVNPIELTLRHARLADVLVELASCQEQDDPGRAALLATSALVYYAPRWQLNRRDNDLPLGFLLHYAEASRLAGGTDDARSMLTRGLKHIEARCGVGYPGLHMIRRRLRALD
jgi:hypothetical protein